MDPAFLLVPLLQRPVAATEDCVIWPGTLAPIVVPMEWTTPRQRAAWLVSLPELPLAQRVDAALRDGSTGAAWRLVADDTRGGPHPTELAAVLDAWAAERCRTRGWTAAKGDLVLLGVDPERRQRRRREVDQARREVVLLLRSLLWPRWHGPLVVACRHGDARDDELPPASVRPALPVVHLPAPPPDDLRPDCGRIIADLALSLSSPPDGDWPAWLRVGVRELAARRAVGDLPSPKRMLERRRRAGPRALARLWSAAEPDAPLASAVVAVLLHTRRQRHFTSFLDALRNGLDTPAALRLAYGLDRQRLLSER